MSFDLFDDDARPSTHLVVGASAESPTMLPLAVENDGAILVVNPARREDGSTRVVSVFHGEAFYFRAITSTDDERDALRLKSDVIHGIDHVRARERLPLLSELIEVVISNYLAERFHLDEAGHCWAGYGDGDESYRHYYPWIPRRSQTP